MRMRFELTGVEINVFGCRWFRSQICVCSNVGATGSYSHRVCCAAAVRERSYSFLYGCTPLRGRHRSATFCYSLVFNSVNNHVIIVITRKVFNIMAVLLTNIFLKWTILSIYLVYISWANTELSNNGKKIQKFLSKFILIF